MAFRTGGVSMIVLLTLLLVFESADQVAVQVLAEDADGFARTPVGDQLAVVQHEGAVADLPNQIGGVDQASGDSSTAMIIGAPRSR